MDQYQIPIRHIDQMQVPLEYFAVPLHYPVTAFRYAGKAAPVVAPWQLNGITGEMTIDHQPAIGALRCIGA